MAKIIETFWDDDLGNGIVDWLVLGLGVVMLGTAIFAAVTPGDRDVAAGPPPAVTTDEV